MRTGLPGRKTGMPGRDGHDSRTWRTWRVLGSWLGLAVLALAGFLLAACSSDGEDGTREIDWKLSDSLKSYDSVKIVLLDPDDTSKVLALVHSGKLPNPASLATYTLPDSVGEDFVILIRGYNDSGLLAFESRIDVEDGDPGSAVRTPAEDLPANQPGGKTIRLAGLDFSEGALTPSFKPDEFSYLVKVPYEVNSLALNATVADSEAVLDIGGKTLASGEASDPLALLVGDNVFTVTVRAKGGSPSQAYAVTVRRAAGNLARLASITLSAGEFSPDFSPDSLKYDVTVPAAVETVAVAAVAEDPLAKVDIGGAKLDSLHGRIVTLKPGASSTLQIAVLSQDSSSRVTYTVKLTRAQSTDATLRSLFVTGVDLAPDFMPDHLTYGSQIAQAQFAVLPVSTDTGATIRVDGAAVKSGALSGLLNSPAVGQAKVVQVEVTAADRKTVRIYSLSLIRVATDNSLVGLTLSSTGANVPLDSPFVQTRLAYKATVARNMERIRIALASTSTAFLDPVASKVSIGDSTLKLTSTSTTTLLKTEIYDGFLALGWNLLKVETTAGATYVVRIFREQAKTADLASLTVSAGVLKPAFSASVLAYVDTVPNVTTAFQVTAAPKDSNATRLIARLKRLAPLIVKSTEQTKQQAADTTPVALAYKVFAIDTLQPGKPSKALQLAVGHNRVEVEVTAEDSTAKKTYVIDVVRRPSPYAYLANLVVNSSGGAALTLNPEFTARTLVYTLSTTTGFVTVTPTEGEAGQTITVAGKAVASGAASGSITLSVGTVDYPVVVTAPDNTTTASYTLRITKRTIVIKDPILTPIP